MLIQSDYHIHASFYRVKAEGAVPGPTAAEQQAAARAAGNRFIGILEHCNHAKHHPFHCLEELAAEYHAPAFDRSDTALGVEADLHDDGSDDCGAEGRARLGLHYVIGSVHLAPKLIADVETYIRTEYTRLRSTLLHNRNVDVIGHPFGEGYRWVNAGIIPRWGFDLIPPEYLAEIVELAKASGKALEINRNDPNDKTYVAWLARIRDAGIPISIGSDAHTPDGCPQAAIRTRWAESLGFTEAQHWKPALFRH
jgi:histidinol phosphatase-like PHP family hydrolase